VPEAITLRVIELLLATVLDAGGVLIWGATITLTVAVFESAVPAVFVALTQ
jgi:hypothetical protein